MAGSEAPSARACENPELRAFLVAIQSGQIVSGTVSGVHHLGDFVHLDGEPQGLWTGFIRVPDLTWDRFNQTAHVLNGTVTKIVPFGVFVRLAPGIEGLLHVSEMTASPVESPDLLVSEGDQITVRVAEVDLQRHRVRFCAHDS
jgi:small subunit ribosomal protein S1